jgi:ubiquinone/menaquinone biosynthesis C-methylase UbiE
MPAGGAMKNLIAHDYGRDGATALEAIERAQWIAFAPFVFQASRCLQQSGLLQAVESARPAGLTLEEARAAAGLSPYAARVLLEAGLAIGLVILDGARYRATRTAHYLLHDPLTQVNMAYTHDVNYRGLNFLTDALRQGQPAGLRPFGPWRTIYEGLAELPEPVRQSWFAGVHYYSDAAFADALPHVFERKPRRLLDIGGNTGKWALYCVRHDPDVRVTILDLPGQLRDAAREVERAGMGARVGFHEANLLEPGSTVPGGFDAVWMSQFLFCFSEEEIVSILQRCTAALDPGARIYVLEPFWDRQRYPLGAFCLQMMSLYFTALANGNSQMYRSTTFFACLERAGLEVERQADHLGVTQSLLVCRKRGDA